MKKLFSIILTLSLLMGLASVATATAVEIKVTVDGEALLFDVPPMIIQGRTMVPVRGVLEALGATVEWEGTTQTVTAVKEDITITMEIGKSYLTVNEETVQLEVPTTLEGDRTLAPVRPVVEGLNAVVEWDAGNQAVVITTQEKKVSYTDELKQIPADISVYYKTVDQLQLPLQVFLPEDFQEDKQYPTVIAIHGGAWASFKETPVEWDGGWMGNTAKHYAKKGYVGIVFSYRDLQFGGEANVGNLIADCRDALSYIAKEYSFVDKNDILLMGDSSGAHLALCLAMGLPDGEELALPIQKVAAYNPVTHCGEGMWSYCAKEPKPYSPADNIKKVDANILVMHGTKDAVVNIEESRSFVEQMEKAGNRISLIEIPEADHAFILFGYMAKDEDIVAALDMTDAYFE